VNWIILIKISSCFAIRHVESKAIQLVAAADFDFGDFDAVWDGELFGCVPAYSFHYISQLKTDVRGIGNISTDQSDAGYLICPSEVRMEFDGRLQNTQLLHREDSRLVNQWQLLV
jgi:hypothetical protein